MSTETNMPRRPGFTLVEMLVVLAIILVLASLAVVYYPKLQDSNQMIRGSDLVVQALSNARQRAKRDNLPTGVRFGPADPTTGLVLQATQIEYIQQPDNFAFGTCWGTHLVKPTPPPGTYDTAWVDFTLPTGVNFQGAAGKLDEPDLATIQPGDYLEVFGGGGVYRILQAAKPATTPRGNAWLNINNPTGQFLSSTTTYRILRQPRKVLGEDPVTLPKNIVLDFALVNTLSPNNAVPVRNVPTATGSAPYYEILFSPSGSVIGQGTGGDKIIMWLRDLTQPTPEAPDPYAGSPVLISVQVRTGFIAANPVAPPPAVWNFYTADPRSSGQ